MVRVTIPLLGKALSYTLDRIALAPKAGCLRPIKGRTDSLPHAAGRYPAR